MLDGSDGTGDSAVLGEEDLRLSLSRLELRREDESLCFEELGLMSDCSICMQGNKRQSNLGA